MVLVESIVNACINVYEKFPKTCKPSEKEWTVISAIVGVFNDSEIKVLSLGTGSKCVGESSMSSKGDVLNDSHAEVIARRAFLKYLYFQLIQLNETKTSKIFDRKDTSNIVFIKNTVKFYFVTSMSPCGDASIMPKSISGDIESYGECLKNSESTPVKNTLKRTISMEEINLKKIKNDTESVDKQAEDIHRTGAKCLPESEIQDPHLPGLLYHSVGAVRTKPGRGDPTLSLSCSDKIARWNAIGWQGALISLFIKTPVFVNGIICGGSSVFSEESFNRAVNERIKKETFVLIQQSKKAFPNIKKEGKKPSPSSIIWCDTDARHNPEVSINGRKQGITKKNLNKKSARTSICKKEFLILFTKVVNTLPCKEKFIEDILCKSSALSLKEITYGELKSKAQTYQNNWDNVKKKYFKNWSKKPVDLLNFNMMQDE